MHETRRAFPYILLVLLSVALGASLMYSLLSGSGPDRLQVKAESVAALPTSVKELEQSVVHAAEIVGRTVVNIDTTGYGRASDGPFPFGEPAEPERKGEGSGVIVTPDGYILTNDHVVRGASEITVRLSDKRQFRGTVKGADSVTDLALVKVNAKDLPTAALGDSDSAPIGTFVIAVGNPFGFDRTLTMGVLSGRGREIPEPGKEFRNLLQTDAAINPGNSGGPLADLQGRVIGINTAVIPRAQNLGFAIPINQARDIMQQLLEKGKVVRAFVGILLMPVNDEVARYLKMPRAEGVLVRQVVPGSPADGAGIERGDVVLAIDGQKVNDVVEFQHRVHDHKVGDKVDLTLWSEGQRKNLSLRVGEMPTR